MVGKPIVVRGKSKIADFLFIYYPLFHMVEDPNLKVKILYFSLEEPGRAKYNAFLCHLMGILDNQHFDVNDMESVEKPRDSLVDELIYSDKYKPYIDAYENMVLVYDTIKNPTGIYKKCKEYALDHGHINYIQGKVKNELTGEWEDGKVRNTIKPYTQDDEDEYRIIIIDNATNLTPEKGLSTKPEIIEKMSKYGVELRNDYNFTFVFIQHQAQSQEGIESIKLGRMRPTSDGLGDCKITVRDVDCILGLYNPIKFLKDIKQEVYEGYNIKRLGKYCRFLEIIDDRNSNAGGSQCGLFFDGAITAFKELPPSEDKAALEKYYKYADYLESIYKQKEQQEEQSSEKDTTSS